MQQLHSLDGAKLLLFFQLTKKNDMLYNIQRYLVLALVFLNSRI